MSFSKLTSSILSSIISTTLRNCSSSIKLPSVAVDPCSLLTESMVFCNDIGESVWKKKLEVSPPRGGNRNSTESCNPIFSSSVRLSSVNILNDKYQKQ